MARFLLEPCVNRLEFSYELICCQVGSTISFWPSETEGGWNRLTDQFLLEVNWWDQMFSFSRTLHVYRVTKCARWSYIAEKLEVRLSSYVIQPMLSSSSSINVSTAFHPHIANNVDVDRGKNVTDTRRMNCQSSCSGRVESRVRCKPAASCCVSSDQSLASPGNAARCDYIT